MARLPLALLLLFCACDDRRLPAALSETLPADAVLDEPGVGLVEPRIEILRAHGESARIEPLLSARADVALPRRATDVSEVREAVISVDVEGVRAPTELTMELRQPGGSPYEVRSATVGGDVWAIYRVTFVLPVAGTSIDRSNLFGQWDVGFFLDGKPLASTSFTLTHQ